MTYFKNVKNLEELKKEYRILSKKFHPDCGGIEAEMKKINTMYESLFEKLKNVKSYSKTEQTDQTEEKSYDFINIINALAKFQKVEIEIVGTWIWLSGETFAVKEEIKALGFKWSKGRKKWYKGEIGSKKKKGSNLTFEQMRDMYGSKKVNATSKKQYAIS